ncbi:MAG: hypothetical protein ABSG03_23460 [Bryobacteraceae bacterium]|jgi:hypothetical protein
MFSILEMLRASADKGRLLELVLQDVLKDRGFSDIQRQLSGSQFGFDLVAHRRHSDGRHEVWKFECKNLGRAVGLHDIAPKLICHRTNGTIDVFVIASVLPTSNALRQLLESHDFPMRIEIWSDAWLEQIILQSKRACERLGVPPGTVGSAAASPQVFEAQASCFLDVAHGMDPPPAFHYLPRNGHTVKAYSPSGFQLLVSITNRSRADCMVRSLNLLTSEFSNAHDRVVILEKPKGLCEPVKINVKPSIHPGSEVDLLRGKIWQIAAERTEIVRVTVASDTTPGLYILQLVAKAQVDGQTVTMSSAAITLHALGKGDDVLRLKVAGRHYDSPVPRLLASPGKEWKKLKRLASSASQFVYLGPAPTDVIRALADREWFIRALPVEDDGPGRKIYSSETGSQIVHSLGIPVEEELYSIEDACRRVMGGDETQGLASYRLSRRGRSSSSDRDPQET